MPNPLLDLVTGGAASDASNQMEQALQAIQGVQLPDINSMEYKLQQLVQQGVLTPEQATAYLQSPSALSSENVDQTGTKAQVDTIQKLMNDAKAGGISPEEEQSLQGIIRGLNTQESGQRGAILQGAASSGALTGGETLAAQLEANQGDAANANEEALATAAQGQNLALQELTTAGSMGSTLQGQENTQANTVASAVDAINKFNATQQEDTNQFNVTNNNAAQAANLAEKQNVADTNTANENAYLAYQAQLPQELEQDAMQKAAAQAGVSEQGADLSTQQGQQMAGLIAAGIGAAGKAATPVPTTKWDGGPVEMRGGGEVPGRARVPGDSPRNDTVPALLSPDEVVLPRSVAQHPQPDKVMDFLRRMKGPKPVAPAHPHDVKSVLDALSLRRGMA